MPSRSSSTRPGASSVSPEAWPPVRERHRSPAHHENLHLVQLAIGWNVAPEPRAIARLTSRFRGAVLRELLRIRTGDSKATWSRASPDVRESIATMVGKHAEGTPLSGHRHTEFLAWCEDDAPTRLLVWRGPGSFDADEQEAVVRQQRELERLFQKLSPLPVAIDAGLSGRHHDEILYGRRS